MSGLNRFSKRKGAAVVETTSFCAPLATLGDGVLADAGAGFARLLTAPVAGQRAHAQKDSQPPRQWTYGTDAFLGCFRGDLAGEHMAAQFRF